MIDVDWVNRQQRIDDWVYRELVVILVEPYWNATGAPNSFSGKIRVSVRVVGEQLVFYEEYRGYPSEHLIAKLLLVLG